MSRRFNPRYIFTGAGYDYSCVALTGVREDDFLRVLSLCEQSETQPGSDWKAHRSEQAKTIEALRNGGYTVNNKGEITVVFEAYNRNKRFQPLTLQSVESVLTGGFLKWSQDLDPDHKILSRLNAMKAPYFYKGEKKYATLTVEDQRLHHLFDTLKTRLDAPRMALFSRWNGPQRGYFGRVIDMSKDETKVRRAHALERAEFNKMLNDLWASRPAAIKAAAEAVAEGTK